MTVPSGGPSDGPSGGMYRKAAMQAALLDLTPNLRAFAISLCGNVDHADDLVQETLLKAWDKSHAFQVGTNLKAWLFTILRNTYFSERRRAFRMVEDADGAFAARLMAAPEQPGKLDLSDVARALLDLPAHQREALLLVGAEGFSYEEAADICGCELGTVKSRVSRARRTLLARFGVETPADLGHEPATAAVLSTSA